MDQNGLACWERIVGALAESKPALAAILEHGVPQTVSRERIVVGFPRGSFYGRQASDADARDAMATAAANVVGGKPDVEVAVIEAQSEDDATLARMEAKRKQERRRETEKRALEHPRVVDAMQVFPEGAGNVEVHVDD